MTVIGDIYSAGDVTLGNGAEVCGSIISSGGGVSLGTVVEGDEVELGLRLLGQEREHLDGRDRRDHRFEQRDRGRERDGIQPVVRDVQQRLRRATLSPRRWPCPARRKRAGRSPAPCRRRASPPASSSSQPVAGDVPRVHVRSGQLLERLERSAAPAVLPDRRHLRLERLDDGRLGLQHVRLDAQDQPDRDVRGLAADAAAAPPYINLDGITLSGDFTLITNAPVNFGNTSTVTTTSSVDRGRPRGELQLPADRLVHRGAGEHGRCGLQHLRQERDRVRLRRPSPTPTTVSSVCCTRPARWRS